MVLAGICVRANEKEELTAFPLWRHIWRQSRFFARPTNRPSQLSWLEQRLCNISDPTDQGFDPPLCPLAFPWRGWRIEPSTASKPIWPERLSFYLSWSIMLFFTLQPQPWHSFPHFGTSFASIAANEGSMESPGPPPLRTKGGGRSAGLHGYQNGHLLSSIDRHRRFRCC